MKILRPLPLKLLSSHLIKTLNDKDFQQCSHLVASLLSLKCDLNKDAVKPC